ncbi:uncharacterized protein LOC131432557 [Malaya genurostris]|uniref:uncharacterized protein LOC131432557 n=1 Tax=Malaya genurostris TaxID=325434 RepID=UPI0026F3EBDE|nr:uncharacterized protein LOC131432557 [Malaya genurostris]
MNTNCTKSGKLHRRSHFLRSGTVPTQTRMRNEIGSDLANVIMELMSPACQQWMGVHRKLLGPSVYCVDNDELKAKIHEHILLVGKEAEDKLERRRRRIVKKKDLREEKEFIKFECQQKIELARNEERKRLERQLNAVKLAWEEKFRIMKSKLGEDYLVARREMTRFMCKNMRIQARHLIGTIARKYKTHLEEEVSRRVNSEVLRLADQVSDFVQAAVEKQKDVDTKAMQQLCFRYEELIRNLRNQEACRQLTRLSQQICSRWTELCRRPSNQEISCQTSFFVPEPSCAVLSESIAVSQGFEGPSEFLEENDLFVIETCPMTPEPSPVYSVATITTESSTWSSGPVNSFIVDEKIFEELSTTIRNRLPPVSSITWKSVKKPSMYINYGTKPPSIDSNFTRDIVDYILATEDMSREEAYISTMKLDMSDPEKSSSTASDASISELFDVEKQESEIELMVNGITLKYIRATERDFE